MPKPSTFSSCVCFADLQYVDGLGMDRIRLWTCQHDHGPSLMIVMMTSFVALLELDLEKVADFAIATLQLVPQGEESGQLGLDAELERLTA